MKFQFTLQQYQDDVVKSTLAVFKGQHFGRPIAYRQDVGELGIEILGEKNAAVTLGAADLLENIRNVQRANDVRLSSKLAPSQGLGACVLDVEMETGTGKTYVYIQTMFELKRAYGWKKFIVVVPTVAIREGVAKSFAVLQDHFMERFGEKARYFIYNSKNLNDIAAFANSSALSVMIINMQAFSASLKPDGTQKEAKIINSERDAFGSRRPIDVIADTRPILILDEPQKLEGAATLNGMKSFKPLFSINYSATHKTKHNLIYALDAVDAFREKLVKRIEVKGFEIRNNLGTSGFLALERIDPGKTGPTALIAHDMRLASGIRRTRSRFAFGDDVRAKANGLNAYAGFVITDIDAARNCVVFENGTTLFAGDVAGDLDRDVMSRIQISETIRSHFEKERTLFARGIKTLSLFFIDEVANYRAYDDEGRPVKAKFEAWFEEEYARCRDDVLAELDEDNPDDRRYATYLRRIAPQETHAGYFSVDAKKRSIDSKVKRDGSCDDKDAYDLILRDKERLLGFDEPVRFVFSHSALQEGWDNPNIFQICTLRSTRSGIRKRQEVGRGLRLCVNASGVRQDARVLGERVHEVNVLTVVANESYKDFVTALQSETRETLRERPDRVSAEFFSGKMFRTADGREHVVTADEAEELAIYFRFQGYVDKDGRVSSRFKDAVSTGGLAPMQPALDEFRPFADAAIKSVQSLFDASFDVSAWVSDGHRTVLRNKINRTNFEKAEFRELWDRISRKYTYTVHYDSTELVEKAVASIEKNLFVRSLGYVKVTGEQREADRFEETGTQEGTERLAEVAVEVPYDLVGDVAAGATLTRRTAADILRRISPQKFALFARNPEEFIRNVSKLIREEKSTMIVEHLSYHVTSERYDSDIFMLEKSNLPLNSPVAAKHVMEYVAADSEVERQLAASLDRAEEVSVYAKLPRSFQIPTPVGNYAPDWAIAFKKGSFRHVFFVAETKGSLDSCQLSAIEADKIECAKKLFNEAHLAGDVRYHRVTSYRDLLDAIRAVDEAEVASPTE